MFTGDESRLGKGIGPRITPSNGKQGDEGLVEDVEVLRVNLRSRSECRIQIGA